MANIHDDSQLEQQALTLLRRFYGYSSFRPMQLEIIRSIMAGNDTLVLMPTGGGKSLTFQIPSLMMDGCTIVVTPIIALMNDLVSALHAMGIPAATVNSAQSEADNRQVVDAMGRGLVKLLYVSPERLLTELPQWSTDLKINFIAIDEAHCISRWGHDFRPDYTRLAEIRRLRPELPVMALTATADKECRRDIAVQLAMRNPKLFTGSFDRPNLEINVLPNPGSRGRVNHIAQLIDLNPSDTGIAYCLSRKSTESLDAALRAKGYRSAAYHAGMSPDMRHSVQARFKSGELQVICATIAFGMGIDKSNIRWVVHCNMPQNIESYYQEIGRAGRDGMPAKAILFYSVADLITLRNFAEESGQREINLQKLERMRQFAESQVCRRRILLSYFGETMAHDCGKCDVCREAPVRYDASTPVRMAMSAILRCNEQVGSSMLIDVLRGSGRNDLIAKGYNRIKTFGAGRHVTPGVWQATLLQMLQMGYIEISYNLGGRISVTPFGRQVLMSQEKIMLPVPQTPVDRRKKAAAAKREKAALSVEEQILAALKKVRSELAAESGIPADMILNDPVIALLAQKKPTNFREFATIEGIGDRKALHYYQPFVRKIREKLGMGALPRGESPLITLHLLDRGYTPAQIAGVRSFRLPTVYQHLAQLVDEHVFSDFSRVATPQQLDLLRRARAANPQGYAEEIRHKLPEGMIRLLLAIDRALS